MDDAQQTYGCMLEGTGYWLFERNESVNKSSVLFVNPTRRTYGWYSADTRRGLGYPGYKLEISRNR